jgi:hypothetical protein
MMVRAVVVAAVFALPLSVAQAESMCSDRQTVVDYLAREHDEFPVSSGLANNGGMVEVLASEGGATWTIIITLPDGATCMMAAGLEWQGMPLVAAATEAEPGA